MKKRASRTAAAVAKLGERVAYDPLKPDTFALALDTREQLVGRVGLDIPIVVGALPMGDLSVPGFESRVAIDRKQLGDFIGCITRDRERFTRLLEKMSELDFAAVVVEATIPEVAARWYHSTVAPAFVLSAAARISTKYGVPVFFCGTLDASTDFAIRLLKSWWKDRGLKTELRAVEANNV